MTDALFAALDRLVPAALDERGDWDAVLAAAVPAAPRRRLTRRRMVAAAAALVALAVVAVTPAFGLRGLISDLVHGRTAVSFYRSRPAPPEIKKRFLDLALGAPRGMNPEVLPAQAKQITLLTPLGHRLIIWVAPTKGGGFCSVGGMAGGCVSRSTERTAGAVTVGGGLTDRKGVVSVFQVSGHVFSPRARTLTLEFADGYSMQLPFVFIGAPIDAGFYALGIPAGHQTPGHWPTRVVARDAQGATVGTAALRLPTRLPPVLPFRTFKPQPPQPLPAASTVTPGGATQTGTADGSTVIAGANGKVRIMASSLPAATAKLLHGRISVSCFRLTREFGIPSVRGVGVEGAFAGSVGLTLSGVGRPLDGCEIDSGRGHRWPDPLGSHSPVEIPLTAKGRAFFADRAAARDLALFVRSGRVQRIRKEPGAQLLRDLKAAYGRALARSRIRYALTANGITFSERSTTGKTFRVVVIGGRVKSSNVAPYAKVF